MLPDYLVFDVETTHLNPAYGARLTCICAKTSKGEWFKEAQEDEALLIKHFLTWLQGKHNYTLITANGKDFDVPFICMRAFLHGLGNASVMGLLSMPHFDLQTITYRKISLSDMAELLLGQHKYIDGKTAIVFFVEKRWDELLSYCQNDVELTEKVYLAYIRNKEVSHETHKANPGPTG